MTIDTKLRCWRQAMSRWGVRRSRRMEENEALVRRWLDGINAGQLETSAQLLAAATG